MTHTFSYDIVGCTRGVLETCLGKQYYDLILTLTFDGGSFIYFVFYYFCVCHILWAWLRTAVRGPEFDNRSGHILLFLLPLIQEGQLSVTGESMCTKYWLTA